MRKLIIAFSLSCVCFAQQPRADVVKTEVLTYDKSKTRVTVQVQNLAPTDIHNVWVKVSGTSSTVRRKISELRPEMKREVTVDVRSEDGPWHAEVESVDWLNQ